jgi:hypothetical protein
MCLTSDYGLFSTFTYGYAILWAFARNWPSRYNWNIVESGVKHHNHPSFWWQLVNFKVRCLLDLFLCVYRITRNVVKSLWEECSADWQCTGNQKCCSNGCGHTCVDPSPGLFKMSPTSPWGQYYFHRGHIGVTTPIRATLLVPCTLPICRTLFYTATTSMIGYWWTHSTLVSCITYLFIIKIHVYLWEIKYFQAKSILKDILAVQSLWFQGQLFLSKM